MGQADGLEPVEPVAVTRAFLREYERGADLDHVGDHAPAELVDLLGIADEEPIGFLRRRLASVIGHVLYPLLWPFAVAAADGRFQRRSFRTCASVSLSPTISFGLID